MSSKTRHYYEFGDLNSGNLKMLAGLGYAYAIAGQRDEAEKILNQLIALSKERYVPPHDVALIYANLGRKDEAFAWLEKSYAERDGRTFLFFKVEPAFDSLRSDTRFPALLRRMKIPT